MGNVKLTPEEKQIFQQFGFTGLAKKRIEEKSGKDYSKAPSLDDAELGKLSEEDNFLVYDWYKYDSDVVYGSGNDLYVNAYKLFKNFPEWISRLNSNPWTYFHVPSTIFDEFGLSNKANNKIAAYQQNYNTYISNLVNEFFNWKNSLPETQREQLNEAGYNADLANVGQSQVSTPNINPTDPSQLAAGNVGEELMNIVSGACSVVSAGISSVLAIGSTMSTIGLQMSQRKGIDLDNAGKDLSNFEKSRNLAKTLFGVTGGDPSPDVLDDAPEMVRNAYEKGLGTTDFQSARLKSSLDLSSVDTDWMLQTMRYENVKDLFGDPDYWKGSFKIAQDAYNESVKKYRDYVEAFDSVAQARSQNGYNDYMQKFYSGLDADTAALLMNEQNSVAFDSLRAQALLIKRNLAIYENDWASIKKHFETLMDPNANKFQKMMSSFFLAVGGVVDRKFLHPENSVVSVPGATGVGSPAASGIGFMPHSLF